MTAHPEQVQLSWRKSTYSTNGGDCVEVAVSPHIPFPAAILVRDSKDPHGPKLAFTSAEWAAFLKGVKAGEFDLG